MDAYDVQQSIRSFWGELSRIVSGDSVKKSFPTVPVYVKIDGRLVIVKSASIENNKIILDTENE